MITLTTRAFESSASSERSPPTFAAADASRERSIRGHPRRRSPQPMASANIAAFRAQSEVFMERLSFVAPFRTLRAARAALSPRARSSSPLVRVVVSARSKSLSLEAISATPTFLRRPACARRPRSSDGAVAVPPRRRPRSTARAPRARRRRPSHPRRPPMRAVLPPMVARPARVHGVRYDASSSSTSSNASSASSVVRRRRRPPTATSASNRSALALGVSIGPLPDPSSDARSSSSPPVARALVLVGAPNVPRSSSPSPSSPSPPSPSPPSPPAFVPRRRAPSRPCDALRIARRAPPPPTPSSRRAARRAPDPRPIRARSDALEPLDVRSRRVVVRRSLAHSPTRANALFAPARVSSRVRRAPRAHRSRARRRAAASAGRAHSVRSFVLVVRRGRTTTVRV